MVAGPGSEQRVTGVLVSGGKEVKGGDEGGHRVGRDH